MNWIERAGDLSLDVYNVVDGKRSRGTGAHSIGKRAPRDGQLLYEFPCGSSSDVDAAVASAKTAYTAGPWPGLTFSERKAALLKLADLVEEHREMFALYESLDVGKPINAALSGDVPSAAARIRLSCEGADKLLSASGADGGVFSFERRKPIGVVGGIVGWNYPLALAAGRVAAALVMGNCIVLKPSELTSLSTCRLAMLALEAGVPSGVFNVVNGEGGSVGDAIARHEDVRLLNFVGSSATGKRLLEAAGQSNMKRLILECGGKSPILVFEDGVDDVKSLAERIVAQAFANQGAVCVAGTRLLVEESVSESVIGALVVLTEKITPGDPLIAQTSFGAIISEAQLEKICRFVARAESAGARRLCGGARVLEESNGYYYTPAILGGVSQRMEIVQEEVFGPVLTVQTFECEDEAVRLANDVTYGLAAYAYTNDLARSQRLARDVEAGLLRIFSNSAPGAGGTPVSVQPQKESGFGPETGLEALAAHTVTTSVMIAS